MKREVKAGLIVLAMLIVAGVAGLIISEGDKKKSPASSITVDCSSAQNSSSTGCKPTEDKTFMIGAARPVGDKVSIVGSASLLGKTAPTKLSANFIGYPDPAAGKFYEGWLVNKKTGEKISAGRLTKTTGAKYSTWENNYNPDVKLSAYDQYVLTSETEGGSAEQETRLAEADLQIVLVFEP